MATLDEQETTIRGQSPLRPLCGRTFGRSEPVARIYTSDSRHLRKLRADDRATEVRGGEDWAEFTVPMEQVNPLKFFKTQRKPMTDEQRAVATERMRRLRAEGKM